MKRSAASNLFDTMIHSLISCTSFIDSTMGLINETVEQIAIQLEPTVSLT